MAAAAVELPVVKPVAAVRARRGVAGGKGVVVVMNAGQVPAMADPFGPAGPGPAVPKSAARCGGSTPGNTAQTEGKNRA